MLASISYAVAYTGVGIALLVLGFFALDLLTPGHLGRHIYEHRSINAAITLAAGFLGQGAIVLLITDGLDRDDAGRLSEEAARLARSCRTLIWLNPLLRYAGFEPRAAGIRALLPHADRFLPLYNVNTLSDLSEALASAGRRSHLITKRAA